MKRKNMRVVQEFLWIVLFPIVVKSAIDCKNFFRPANECDRDECFIKGRHTISYEKSEHAVHISCKDKRSPNIDLIRCFKFYYLRMVTFTSCTFKNNFLIGKFLHHINLTDLEFYFDGNKQTQFDIQFLNMPTLVFVSINHLRVKNRFLNLTFGENPELRFLQINDHNISELRLVFTDVSILLSLVIENGTLTNLKPIYNVSKLENLFLNWNHISSLSRALLESFRKLRKIRLIGNRLEHIDETLFSGLQNLEEINLSSNRLISTKNWIYPPRLRYLMLDKNRLQHIDLSLMNFVDSKDDISIRLSYNEWICNCSLLEWLSRKADKISDYKNIFCTFSGRDYENFTIQPELGHHLCFFPNEGQFIPVVTILLLVLTEAALVYYCRYTITVFFHDNILAPCFSYLDEPIEEKEYDVFLCCGENNASIIEIFINELEPTKRLCIPERDWEVEAPITYNIEYSIRNSGASLLFITQNTLEQMWFQVQLRGAYNQRLEDGVHKVILVKGEDVEGVSLKDDIRQLIEKESQLEWGTIWFWEKLFFELRCQKRRN